METKDLSQETLFNFRLCYINAYEELLEELKREDKYEEDQANNLITSHMINEILEKEEKEGQENVQHAHLATENKDILEMKKNMMQKITALENNKTNKKQEKGKMAWRKKHLKKVNQRRKQWRVSFINIVPHAAKEKVSGPQVRDSMEQKSMIQQKVKQK